MKPIIALDADGVLLDYHHAYRNAWARAFGALPAVRDPDAYWPLDRWEVRRLAGDDLETFRQCFDYGYWSTIPALDGAVDACHRLVAAGYELVCVSAVEAHNHDARLVNLRACGFPIERLMSTPGTHSETSPKASALRALRPVAFVDDFAPYLRGVPDEIHTALVLREPNGSPNTGEALTLAKSTHTNLAGFVEWWLGNMNGRG